MNKFIIMLFLIATQCSSIADNINWIDKTFRKNKWENIHTIVKNPKEASSLVRKTIIYKEDLGDEWKNGEQTWDSGFGDCEDIAITIMELLNKINVTSTLFIMHPKNSIYGHVVLIGEWENKKWMSSNGFFYRIKNIEHAKIIVQKEMLWRNKEIIYEEWKDYYNQK